MVAGPWQRTVETTFARSEPKPNAALAEIQGWPIARSSNPGISGSGAAIVRHVHEPDPVLRAPVLRRASSRGGVLDACRHVVGVVG